MALVSFLLLLSLAPVAALDFSSIRGVNYIPSNAVWDFFGSDVWDEALVRKEMG